MALMIQQSGTNDIRAYPCGAERGVGHAAGRGWGQGVRVRHHGQGVLLEGRSTGCPLSRLQSLNFPSQHQRIKMLQVLRGDQASDLRKQRELRGIIKVPRERNERRWASKINKQRRLKLTVLHIRRLISRPPLTAYKNRWHSRFLWVKTKLLNGLPAENGD